MRNAPLPNFLHSFYHAAANLIARIAGRLCGKVITHTMDDNGSTDNIFDIDAAGKEGHPCIAIVAKQRRQIACMLRMRDISRIVMVAGVRERLHAHLPHITPWLYNAGERHHISGIPTAVAEFMNMHTKEAGAGKRIYLGTN